MEPHGVEPALIGGVDHRPGNLVGAATLYAAVVISLGLGWSGPGG
jgi:hypothetical protein